MGTFFAKIYLKLIGWKVDFDLPEGVDRCVMIAAPHTSNWDIIITKAAFIILKIPLRFTIKKEWLAYPQGIVIKAMGGIGIDRRPKNPGEERPSMSQAMAALFKKHDRLVVMVTPEGTRKLRTEWKTGFYYVAKMAQVPVALGYLDFANKTAGVGPAIMPGENIEEDLQKIMSFYQTKAAKFPEKFSTDIRYTLINEVST
ncbi:MAG: 1-acyl-sn-glycerol-3-phosphate acyltransferase [Limisphaerales bacterium]|jgi:1-acyl-sn-glycerol-3-phosphate acyltransferase